MAALRVFKIKTYLLFGSYSILSCTPVLSSFSLGPEKSNYVDQRELCHRGKMDHIPVFENGNRVFGDHYQDGGSFSDLSKDESDDQDRESLSEVFEGKEKSYYPNIEPFSDFSESEYEQYTEIIERIKRILDQQLTDVLPLATEQTLDSWIINFNKYFQENCRFEQLHDSCIKLAQYVPLLLKRLEGIRGANDNYNRSEKICWMRFYAKKDPGIISVEPKLLDEEAGLTALLADTHTTKKDAIKLADSDISSEIGKKKPSWIKELEKDISPVDSAGLLGILSDSDSSDEENIFG
ncbi:uncharacterized protein LOC122788282 isoform X3 [Protopterus annectens]|uniref:uncharacterized protein LOC122788282 isoform X3 n=1 Tax=Protopterus annectens TaxID=7888 RepID=UPI001CFA0DA2|nr:uncharacterized protein LOC122788282 isoform X3 [Protopterus annectens]